MPPIARPRGTNDLLPPDSALRAWVLDTHRQVAEAHGYALIDTPVFEATELYERGTGAGTDVVEKEMFSFTDRGGRGLTLRPEGTPGLLRAVLAAHLDQERRPVRVHFAGPMFRYARPQAGRYHEFWQVDIEAIGERSPALDAEVIEVAWRFYEALGVTGLSLQVNTLGDLEDRIRYRTALVAYYTPLQDRLCADCRRRLGTNPLRLLDCKRDAGLVAGAPEIGPSLSPESHAFFAKVAGFLDAAGIPFRLNPRLVRGLDYYAHTAFELWHESLQGAQNAVGGGGRYDGLAKVLGFAPTPGTGYALGVERTMAVCREQGLPNQSRPGTGWSCSASGKETGTPPRPWRERCAAPGSRCSSTSPTAGSIAAWPPPPTREPAPRSWWGGGGRPRGGHLEGPGHRSPGDRRGGGGGDGAPPAARRAVTGDARWDQRPR